MQTGKATEKFISDWLAAAPGFSVLVELDAEDEHCIRIKKLQCWPTDRAGKEETTRVLETLCRLADYHNIALCGNALPYAKQLEAAIGLRLLLAHFGFEPSNQKVRELELYRPPKAPMHMPAARA